MVITEPPTAKLPCSWMISGSDLLPLFSCARAEVKTMAAMNESARSDLGCLVLIDFSPTVT